MFQIPDFNQIARLDEARNAYLKSMDPKSPAYARDKKFFDEAFDQWYTGNVDPKTGLITLYKFLGPSYPIDELSKGGLLPTGYLTFGSEQRLIEYLLNPESRPEFNDDPAITRELVDALQKQQRGEDMSDFMVDYAQSSSASPTNISQSLTAGSEIPVLARCNHRVEVRLNPNAAWRTGKLDEDGNWVGRFDDELEWTVLGPIPYESIVEVKKL